MKIEDIEPKSTQTKAIMMVHMYGLTVDVDQILNLAKKYNLKVIEDAAHAIGLTIKANSVVLRDISIFGFIQISISLLVREAWFFVTIQFRSKIKKLEKSFFSDQRFVHHEIGLIIE